MFSTSPSYLPMQRDIGLSLSDFHLVFILTGTWCLVAIVSLIHPTFCLIRSTCTLQVHGVRGSVFQFYTSHILAVNTWWDLYLNDTVRVVLPGGSEVTQGSQPAKLTLAQLRINPEDYQKFYTDICAKGETPRAIVVFVGLKTGVFKD